MRPQQRPRPPPEQHAGPRLPSVLLPSASPSPRLGPCSLQGQACSCTMVSWSMWEPWRSPCLWWTPARPRLSGPTQMPWRHSGAWSRCVWLSCGCRVALLCGCCVCVVTYPFAALVLQESRIAILNIWKTNVEAEEKQKKEDWEKFLQQRRAAQEQVDKATE
jgi:hypothetical protein